MKKLLLILFISILSFNPIIPSVIPKTTDAEYPLISLALSEDMFCIDLFFPADQSYDQLSVELAKIPRTARLISLNHPFVLLVLTKHAVETGKIEILSSLLKLFYTKNPCFNVANSSSHEAVKLNLNPTEKTYINDLDSGQFIELPTDECIIRLIEYIEKLYPDSENKKKVISLYKEFGIYNHQSYKGDPIDENSILLNNTSAYYRLYQVWQRNPPFLGWSILEKTNPTPLFYLRLGYPLKEEDEFINLTNELSEEPSTYSYKNLVNDFSTTTIEDAYGPGLASVNYSNTVMFFIDHAMKTGNFEILQTLLKLRTVPYESWYSFKLTEEEAALIESRDPDNKEPLELTKALNEREITETTLQEKVSKNYPESERRNTVLQLLEKYEIKNNN